MAFNRRRLNGMLPYLVSLAAGALLGAAGAHLLPEAIQQLGSDRHLSGLLLTGFVGFFLVEKIMGMLSSRWPVLSAGHDHGDDDCPHHPPEVSSQALRTNLLFGGAIHSMIDGTAIVIAYSASLSAGVATTVAVLLHEVPHHIGDVGVLVYGGLAAQRAVVLKLAASSAALLGIGIVLLPGSQGRTVASHLLPVTAASFIYIALANLMPELHRENGIRRSLGQVVVFVCGILTLYALNFLREG